MDSLLDLELVPLLLFFGAVALPLFLNGVEVTWRFLLVLEIILNQFVQACAFPFFRV